MVGYSGQEQPFVVLTITSVLDMMSVVGYIQHQTQPLGDMRLVIGITVTVWVGANGISVTVRPEVDVLKKRMLVVDIPCIRVVNTLTHDGRYRLCRFQTGL